MAETEAIEQALAVRDLGALDLAFQPGGFGQDDALRLRCWGALVGVEVARSPGRCFAMRHPFDEYGRKTKVGAREGSPSVDL